MEDGPAGPLLPPGASCPPAFILQPADPEDGQNTPQPPTPPTHFRPPVYPEAAGGRSLLSRRQSCRESAVSPGTTTPALAASGHLTPRTFKRSESLSAFSGAGAALPPFPSSGGSSPSLNRSASFNQATPKATPRRGSLRANRILGQDKINRTNDLGQTLGPEERLGRPEERLERPYERLGRPEERLGKLTQRILSDNQLNSPRPSQEKSIFPSFENLKEVLFGESRLQTISPSRTLDNLQSFSKKVGGGGGGGVGEGERRRRSKTPRKDEFTEFSQYGSRYTLNQLEDRGLETSGAQVPELTAFYPPDCQEKGDEVIPSPRAEERRQPMMPGGKQCPGVGSSSQLLLHKIPADPRGYSPITTTAPPHQLCWSEGRVAAAGGFQPSAPLSLETSCTDISRGRSSASHHLDSGRRMAAAAAPDCRTFGDRLLKSVMPKSASSPLTESDKFRALNYLAGRLRQHQQHLPQSPHSPANTTTSGGDGSGDVQQVCGVQPPPRAHQHRVRLKGGLGSKSDSDSGFGGDASSTGTADSKIKQIDMESEYDLIQLVGEGWFSRVYLAEHRLSRGEVVLKAINCNLVTVDEFYREYQSSVFLSSHKNILKIFDVVFQSDGYFMFATEYAPLGDLTSNITECGLGETYTKRVVSQIGAALHFIHSKGLCHLDVKLDNILVFRSDFSLVKLCDFGSVRPVGDIVIKKNELLPYCPAELVAKHANEYYQVDRVQDVFQFGIVAFFCLLGILPWQKADLTDPHFNEFVLWRRKRTSKLPRNFKSMTTRSQKLFRKLLDPDPGKRLELTELPKYLEDKWIRRGGKAAPEIRGTIGDHLSQLTLGSFQSVHSNAVEKNRMLYTLLQHGVETTVDRRHKTHRIINWIKQGAERGDSLSPTGQNYPGELIPEEESLDQDGKEEFDMEDLEAIDIDQESDK